MLRSFVLFIFVIVGAPKNLLLAENMTEEKILFFEAGKEFLHTWAVFEGAILQTPHFLDDGSLFLLTDDNSLQRFSFENGLIWKYDFHRIPWGIWQVQFYPEGIYVPMTEKLLFFDKHGYVGISSFPWMKHSDIEMLRIFDGRMVIIHDDVIISPSHPIDAEDLMIWHLIDDKQKHKHFLSSEGNIIIQTNNRLLWYTLDGIALAEVSIDHNQDNVSFVGNEIIIHSSIEKRYWKYTSNGDIITSGFSPGRGQLITTISGEESNSLVYIYIDNKEVFTVNSTGIEHSLLRLEPPWKYEHIVIRNNFLYISDSSWKLHRFNIEEIAKSLFKITISSSHTPVPLVRKASKKNFLAEFLIELVNQPEKLWVQLQSIQKKQILRGDLLKYAEAFHILLKYIYASEIIYSRVTPAIRGLALKLYIQYGGMSDLKIAMRFLSAETHAHVFMGLIPLFASKTVFAQKEFIEVLNRFLYLTTEWQHRDVLIEQSLLYYIELYNRLLPENRYLRTEIIEGLELTYHLLNDTQRRREILDILSKKENSGDYPIAEADMENYYDNSID